MQWMINIKPFLVIYCILKENKTHYKVSHFPPVNSNPIYPAYCCISPNVGVGSLMNHGAGSVNSQSIELIYVMASEPYRYPWYLKQSWQVCHTLRFTLYKTLIALKVKFFWTKLKFSLNKILGRYAKIWFFKKIIFCRITFQSQCMVI